MISRFNAMQPASYSRLAWFMRSEFHIDVFPDTLRKIIFRDQRLKPVIGQLMEILRTQSSPESIAEYFPSLVTVLDHIPISFVWNMGEIGHADWPDAHADTVYASFDCSSDIVPIAISSTGKYITLVGDICAAGSYPKPTVILPPHTVDLDLTLLAVSDRNCHICHQSNGFIDREPFERWLVNILFVTKRPIDRHADSPGR
jgi:hypothetical protein